MKMRPTAIPDVDDITMIIPTKITDMGIYIQLIEYNNIEGFIPLSELSKYKIRSINKIAKVGKKFPAIVLSIDEKKYITLSKKMVSDQEAKKCENNYKILKNIYDLINFFVRKLDKEHHIKITIEKAYEEFIWSLSHDINEIITSLKIASKDFDRIYEKILLNIDPVTIECFKQVLELKFKVREVLLEAVLDITCYETGGINIIKSALIKASEMATAEYPFKIKLIKSPYYSITIRTITPEPVTELITNVIANIKTNLEMANANIKIVKIPEIVIDKEFEVESSDSENSDYDD
jgi:translation initiation factor 2 subunit 1